MTMLQNKQVITRKQHQCFGCLKIFPVGTELTYRAGIYEREFNSYYLCHMCVKAESFQCRFADSYGEGDLAYYHDDVREVAARKELEG